MKTKKKKKCRNGVVIVSTSLAKHNENRNGERNMNLILKAVQPRNGGFIKKKKNGEDSLFFFLVHFSYQISGHTWHGESYK